MLAIAQQAEVESRIVFHEEILKMNIASTTKMTFYANQVSYRAEITAGGLKIRESRMIADLLLRRVQGEAWHEALYKQNVLQGRNPETVRRLSRLIGDRLRTMSPDLWRLIRDGSSAVATHACLAAAVKHSPLLGDFLDLVVREQYRLFRPALSNKLWDDYLVDCRGRDSEMPLWNESTRRRLRSSVFQSLAQAGFIESTRSLKLQPVHIAPQVLNYLRGHHEDYVLRCIELTA
jgi:Putative inner membrane protein (DUF1819)